MCLRKRLKHLIIWNGGSNCYLSRQLIANESSILETQQIIQILASSIIRFHCYQTLLAIILTRMIRGAGCAASRENSRVSLHAQVSSWPDLVREWRTIRASLLLGC
jgi:hypothetical protein